MMNKFSVPSVSSFLFRSSKFSRLSHQEAPSLFFVNVDWKEIIAVFILVLLVIFTFFKSSFYFWSSSWRLIMVVVRQAFLSILKVYLQVSFSKLIVPPSYTPKTYSVKCFVFRSSSILHLAFPKCKFLSPLSFKKLWYIILES